MTNWVFWVPMFLLLGAPTAMLMLDRIQGLPAPKFLRTQGIPALGLFTLLATYLAVVGDSLFDLVLWGLVGGLVATVALDAVRLVGVRLGAFPMDMPTMFGLISLGLAPAFQRNILANMVARVADMPEDQRKQFMVERIHFMGAAPERTRRMMLSGMSEGLSRLPEEKRMIMRRIQMEILASSPGRVRRNIMATMDALSSGSPSSGPKEDRAARGLKMPQIPMSVFRSLEGKARPQTIEESSSSLAKVLTAGYLWHFVNGATYGIAYTFIFGQGSWALAILWGVFIWVVMMASMPKMMPMIKFPFPKFMLVPLIAHIAMAVPIGFFALAFVSPEAHLGGFVAGTGIDGLLRFLHLL
ncbi:MAG: hypothetical protein ACE5IB_00260 [Candidatus Geothermarchaeales archaeon]